jgi:aspartokinase|tara:strand:+ start:1256 stop:1552 length:297 start_codon:yes stop_codon:yes gene_type:complete
MKRKRGIIPLTLVELIDSEGQVELSNFKEEESKELLKRLEQQQIPYKLIRNNYDSRIVTVYISQTDKAINILQDIRKEATAKKKEKLKNSPRKYYPKF